MHFNILLTLSTLTALSSNAAAQISIGLFNGLGALGSQGVPSGQIPTPSSTPIPTLLKMLATSTAFPFTVPSWPTGVPHISPSMTPSLPTSVPYARFSPL
ncbi:hypothetical protein LT330_005370 [Penicillium expansum]|nr:hypothetical protein LT330_005370 [Penicillium expansum]